MLVFIDESGHPHPNDAATRPVLVSVCVDMADMKTINTDLFKIKQRILRKEQFEFEAKGSDLITLGISKTRQCSVSSSNRSSIASAVGTFASSRT